MMGERFLIVRVGVYIWVRGEGQNDTCDNGLVRNISMTSSLYIDSYSKIFVGIPRLVYTHIYFLALPEKRAYKKNDIPFKMNLERWEVSWENMRNHSRKKK